ncbi:hypothetical protein T229_12370 [Tannerella sp. oral taxon BU063 isolate Cell 5]|uniref:Uncharacterized protein n=1 Tax=Tannerella sp. oral taxon BU063 isolate Cell 5 TaxID=1410950 RepID=W2C998_9BACT|nr:hypothetical protein T229_12370 [Tannerella sp. oral taxon BU063 isolate Cell 5]
MKLQKGGAIDYALIEQQYNDYSGYTQRAKQSIYRLEYAA